jgi:hypothetical protein
MPKMMLIDDRNKGDMYFKVQTDMIKIASDLDWYRESKSEFARDIDDEFLEQHRTIPKVKELVDNTIALYKDGKKQIIFTINTKLHDEIKKQLVKGGVKADEIAIVNSDTMKNTLARKKVSDLYNSGKYKVVIGNYATMGEGLNFNYMTSDIHHLQPTWNALQLIQGNGRGIRQGNPLDEVNTHYYLSKGSIDAFMLNKIIDKGNMVDDFLLGRTNEWNDEISASGDELLIELSGNPEQARKLKEARNKALQNAIRIKQEDDARIHLGRYFGLKTKLETAKKQGQTQLIPQIEQDLENTKKLLINNPAFEHVEILEERETPIIMFDEKTHKLDVIPINSVLQATNNLSADISKDNIIKLTKYSPSTGKIYVEIYPEHDRPYQGSLDYSAFSKFIQLGGLAKIKKEESSKKFDEWLANNRNKYYFIPKEKINEYRGKMTQEDLGGDHRILLKHKKTGEYSVESGYNLQYILEKDPDAFEVVFPTENPEEWLPKILSQIKKEDGSYSTKYVMERFLKEVYGDVKNAEKELKKMKGETITESNNINEGE